MIGHRLRPLLAVLAAISIVAIGYLLLRPSADSVTDALLNVCKPDSVTSICNITLVEEAITSTATASAVVDVALAVLDTRPGEFGGCHSALHTIGRRIAGFVALGQPLPSLGDRWNTCGYALAHGTMEYMPLGSDIAAAVNTARKLCAEITADAKDAAVCAHSTGHAFHNSLGKDFTTTANACRMLYHARNDLYGCITAGYMSIAEASIRKYGPGNSLRTASDFTSTLPSCDFGDPYDYGCPQSFSPLATRSVEPGPLRGYFTWCEHITYARPLCVEAAGTSLGIDLAATPERLVEVYPLCVAATSGKDELSICIHGARSGGKSGGVPEGELLNMICDRAKREVSCQTLADEGAVVAHAVHIQATAASPVTTSPPTDPRR